MILEAIGSTDLLIHSRQFYSRGFRKLPRPSRNERLPYERSRASLRPLPGGCCSTCCQNGTRHLCTLASLRGANTVPDDWEEGVSDQEYWQQVSSYADMTVEMASNDTEKLKELIDRLDKLTLTAFDKVLEYLSSEAVSSQSEDQRADLWEQLTMLPKNIEAFRCRMVFPGRYRLQN